MKTRIILAVAVVLILAIALTSGASNMGFKLSQTFGASVVKYIGLPYYNSYSTQSAAYLRNDIVNAGGGAVSVYNWNGTAWQRWSGGGGGQVNFALAPGAGYQVSAGTAVSNWVVVGSHNPSTTIPFSASVVKYVALPYHTTSTSAALFRNELVAAGGGAVSVYNWTGTAWQRWSGGGGGQVNFVTTPGLAYQVSCGTAVAAWTPSHY